MRQPTKRTHCLMISIMRVLRLATPSVRRRRAVVVCPCWRSTGLPVLTRVGLVWSGRSFGSRGVGGLAGPGEEHGDFVVPRKLNPGSRPRKDRDPREPNDGHRVVSPPGSTSRIPQAAAAVSRPEITLGALSSSRLLGQVRKFKTGIPRTRRGAASESHNRSAFFRNFPR